MTDEEIAEARAALANGESIVVRCRRWLPALLDEVEQRREQVATMIDEAQRAFEESANGQELIHRRLVMLRIDPAIIAAAQDSLADRTRYRLP